MYCPRLFIVVLQELHCLLLLLLLWCVHWKVCVYQAFLIGCCVSELRGHMCPIVMYCVRLFIVVLQELHCLSNCLHVVFRVRICYSPSYSNHLVSEIALPEAVYCCFTRTTLFTVIIVVCLLKRMCMPSFILIGCCVSELHGHLCPYRNVLPEAVYCCFTRTTLFTET